MRPSFERPIEPTEQPETPARCPACGARDVMTTSKVITIETYWRCGACGDVWNVERQRKASRYMSRRF